MELSTLLEQLSSFVSQATQAFAHSSSYDDLVQEKNRYLGKKGKIQEVMKHLRNLPNQEKRQLGQASNHAKKSIESAYEQQLASLQENLLKLQLQNESIDVTLPGKSFRKTSGHPLRIVENDLVDLFTRLGFDVATGPEIETDFFNFEALNFPDDHPARDEQDTFLTQDHRLLRTHTSPVQVRTLLNYQPPIRIIAPGRVYRCDNDVTHSPVFHQIEGLYVDKDVSFKDLKGTLKNFVELFFGVNTPIRLRASFFPFTEPSAEVDIACVFCQQAGCRICKQTGWLEVLGSGMVHPHVLEKSHLDPDVYSGFAFGLGIERLAMLRYAVPDIRFFYDGNLEFLRQF